MGRRRQRLTEAELDLIAPAAIQPDPWLLIESISAAASREVLARHGQEPDDRPKAQRAAEIRAAKHKAMATARRNGPTSFSLGLMG